MTDRKVTELTEKSKQVLDLIKEIKDLATENDFGVSFDEEGDSIQFNDWLSSSCYGEGNDENFGISGNGDVWYSSSC